MGLTAPAANNYPKGLGISDRHFHFFNAFTPCFAPIPRVVLTGTSSAQGKWISRIKPRDGGTRYILTYLLVPSGLCQKQFGSYQRSLLEAERFSATTAGTDFFTFYPRTKQPSPGPHQSQPFVKWLCKRGTKGRRNLDAVPALM